MGIRLLFFLLVATIVVHAADPQPNWDGVTGLSKVRFKYDKEVSDEFRGRNLDKKKWDPHGLRNENNDCSKWNGPVNWEEPIYSTYHQTSTETNGKKTKKRQLNYRVRRGQLRIRVTSKPLSYFTAREYYCDKKTFHCNHNKKIPCYGTKYNGEPILKDPNDPKSYKYINHDKCKIEPFCIPHPAEVTGGTRKYQKYLGVNIAGKKLFKYGYFETRIKIADSPAVNAVWMHDDNTVPGYSRWIQDSKGWYIFESPTVIRSRRWQEIDIVEAMNTANKDLWKKYIPNVHLFAAYKGEFTRRRPSKKKLGEIILDRDVFRAKNPRFTPPDPDRANEYHMNYGHAAYLSEPWASSYQTVGMYWSPKEIRFIFNGKEVLRLRNSYVHQAMSYDIGTGVNKEWGEEAPKNSQLGRWTYIDYVRRWTVKTKRGRDPPSSLPLLKVMPKNFKKLGRKYLAVDGIFPVKDDGKTIADPAVRLLGSFFNSLPRSSFSEGNGASSFNPEFQAEEDDENELADPDPVPSNFWDNEIGFNISDLLPAGGEGNPLFSFETGRKRKFTPEERKGAESRPDRLRDPDVVPRCEKDMAQTAFEDNNPEVNLAGWATKGGEGKDAGVIPEGQCA